MTSPRIAVVGAGIGGMALAIGLAQKGLKPTVLEQASQFRRVGAGINLTPNAVKVLDGLGIGPRVRETAFRPACRLSRQWDTGAETSRLALGDAGESRYGAPQLTIHRADLLSAMEEALPSGSVQLGCKVQRIEDAGDAVTLHFADGESDRYDAVIGADGIHSAVREKLLGTEEPRFTGKVAFRSTVPAAALADLDLAPTTKWWGPDSSSQLFTFLINGGRELFVFATMAAPEWTNESWSIQGTKQELVDAYASFHPEAVRILSHCEVILKTAMYARDPLDHWTEGRITLLGDACHAMLPFMAQGAAMGLEDAAVLSRCLQDADAAAVPAALLCYERTRRERASRIQVASSQNDWLRSDSNADWVYGYDAWTTPLIVN